VLSTVFTNEQCSSVTLTVDSPSWFSGFTLRHVKAWDPLQLRPPLGVVEITLFLNDDHVDKLVTVVWVPGMLCVRRYGNQTV